MSTVASEPIVPPPLPSFRLEMPKVASPVSGESAADVEANIGARIDRAAVVIVDEGKNGIRREIAIGHRRDRNICVAADMAAAAIQDLECGVAHNVDVRWTRRH